MATSKSPATTDSARAFESVVDRVKARASMESGLVDAFEIGSRVIDKMAAAETLDDMFDAAQSSLTSLQDATNLHNVPVYVTDIRYAKSDPKFAKGGIGGYAIITLVTDDGQVHTLSCGAPNVVAFLDLAELKGHFKPALNGEETSPKPLRLRFTSRGTENGNLLSIAKP